MMAFKTSLKTVSKEEIIGNSFIVALKTHLWYVEVNMRSAVGRSLLLPLHGPQAWLWFGNDGRNKT